MIEENSNEYMKFEKAFDFLKAYLESDKYKIINPKRVYDIMEACKFLKTSLTSDTRDSSIEITEGALQLGDVAIRITIPQFTSYQPSVFANIIRKADNIDIYPTNGDRIRIDIQFQNTFFVTTNEAQI